MHVIFFFLKFLHSAFYKAFFIKQSIYEEFEFDLREFNLSYLFEITA